MKDERRVYVRMEAKPAYASPVRDRVPRVRYLLAGLGLAIIVAALVLAGAK